MSVVKDTTKLRPYKRNNLPKLDESLLPFLSTEFDTLSSLTTALIAALKSIEARIVAGGL